MRLVVLERQFVIFYNGLSKLDTKYSNDNESNILKSRLIIGALSCREKEEILVQSLKKNCP